MFEHLVESGSHSEDFKRKGSFLAGFAVLYLVLIFTVMIVGILLAPAYIDQHLHLHRARGMRTARNRRIWRRDQPTRLAIQDAT